MKYFGTDGIRGKAEMFTGEFLEKIVRGLGVEGKRVLIGGDTRESTKHILENLERSLKNNGAKEVGNIGVFPTPGINNVFYSLVYDFAIDVTASHNPYTDNGIKIFEYADGSGIKLNEEGRERIEKELASDSPFELKVPDVETEFFDEKARGLEYYKNHLRDYLGTTDLSGLRVTLDCANGATGIVGGSVFEELGAEVEAENNDTDFGRKINDGVGSTHPEGLQEKVRSGEFNLGAAFDGDGDRCMLVDEKGELVDGDQILVILANFLHLDKIAGTVMANQGLLNWGKEHGVEVITTDVGDQNVAAAMREQDIKIGGEQSGHIILPREAMGDGMLTALMVAKAMKETGRSLSDLAGEMKKFPQTMLNVPASREEKEMLKTSEAVKATIAEFSERLNAVHGRFLVRPSGTEDLVRITLWGEEQEKIDLLANELAEKLTEEFKNGRN